jgi:hypothetical protein
MRKTMFKKRIHEKIEFKKIFLKKRISSFAQIALFTFFK